MDFFTMNRQYEKVDEIDKFISGIWTERYYGDSEVELIVPPTSEMIQKLPEGTFLGEAGSQEVMIIETAEILPDQLKLTGISLLPWCNNRFIRATALHEDQYWNTPENTPGWIMWALFAYWVLGHSPPGFLDGTIDIGIPNPSRLIIPGIGLNGFNNDGPNVVLTVPYEPVYNAMRTIGTTYNIGMTLTLEPDDDYYLKYLNYKGLDRTSGQTVNQPVRFSSFTDTLTDSKELRSLLLYKNLVYTFVPGSLDTQDSDGHTIKFVKPGPGEAIGDAVATGFDLRALMEFEQDITTDQVNGDPAVLSTMLNTRATKALKENKYIKTADGEIVPTHECQYGRDYNMGDLIEIEGKSGIVQICRVMEYIRAQDATGEKTYPSVEIVDDYNETPPKPEEIQW